MPPSAPAAGPAHPARCALVLLVATAAGLGALGAVVPVVVDPGPTGVASTLVRGCAVALVGCVAWAWLAVAVAVVEALRGARLIGSRGVPAPVRRAVLLACGVALAGGLSSPALAYAPLTDPLTAPPSPASSAPSPVLPDLAGLPLPERPTGAERSTSRPAGPSAHVVRAGDSLWSIARSREPRATQAETGAAWRALYAANRAVIGDDPDLIQPGQRLRLPPR